MASIVGFSVFNGIDNSSEKRAKEAQERALSYYKHLENQAVEIGQTKLSVWGHPDVSDRLHWLPNGDLLVSVGSPHNSIPWSVVEEGMRRVRSPEEYELPWEGRVVRLEISADGERWRMWNDWIGSIPVYHARVGEGWIASTLEPVVVAGGGYTPNDFYLPGLVSLLINGQFISDWTLYKEMKVAPPDSFCEWDEGGFRPKRMWTVKPSQDRWESGWDDLVDEMYDLTRKAIGEVLKTRARWVLPLSSGLDSRLIAAVGAELGVDMRAYAWGEKDSTDVVYSRQIAKVLGIPWKHIELPRDFLVKYTRQWADLFGSAMHFHGMYLMSFLDRINEDSHSQMISGFMGDALTGAGLFEADELHSKSFSPLILPNYSTHWSDNELDLLLKVDLNQALQQTVNGIRSEINGNRGVWFQKMIMLIIFERVRLFTYFQCTLGDYWRGLSTPLMNRGYSRFCLSLPRTAFDGRRLLKEVYRRHYGRLAVIP